MVEIEANINNQRVINTFWRVFPQFLAAVSKNVIVVNKALFDGFPALVIASVTGKSPKLNPDETILIGSDEVVWLSSLVLITRPIGSLFGARLSDSVGRQRTMKLIAAPIFIAFLLMGFTQTYQTVCIAFAILGFFFGLEETPTTIYVSEISEPSLRGTLMAMGPLASSIGALIIYVLGANLSWRRVSFICAALPVIIYVVMRQVPESPIWLLSKQRFQDAMQSLQWLRGWVAPENVRQEFNTLQAFSEISNSCSDCSRQSIRCTHTNPGCCQRITEFKRKRSLKPILLIFCLQFILEFSVIAVWTPYMIQILKALGIPWQANDTTVVLSVIGLMANICLLFIVRIFGKRQICLIATIIVVACSFGLSFYGLTLLPSRWSSFENSNEHDADFIRSSVGNYGYIALFLICTMQFFTKMGVGGSTLIIVGEVFPFKVRSFLTGFSIGFRYLFASIATRTYYEVETLLSLPGAIALYAGIGMIGFIVMYLILPETEHRSLSDIETHYSDNTKRIIDIDIPINTHTRMQ